MFKRTRYFLFGATAALVAVSARLAYCPQEEFDQFVRDLQRSRDA